MNAFNRFLIVILLCVGAVIGALALISPPTVIWGIQWLANAGHDLLGELQPGLRLLVRLAVAVLFLCLMGLMLWLEMRRPNAKSVEVQRAQGGRIRLGVGDVQQRISENVEAISGVISARVKVIARNKGVGAEIEAVTAPGMDPIAKGEEIAETARTVVENQLGLKMSVKPHVTVKVGKQRAVKMKPVTPRGSIGRIKPQAQAQLPAPPEAIIDVEPTSPS